MGNSTGASASDFERIRKSEHPINEAGSVLAERAGDAVEQIGKRTDTAIETASTVVADAREKGAQAANQATDVIGNFRQALESSARARPVTTVLMALGAGLLFGALWRSGGSNE